MAMSARLSRVSKSSPSSGYIAMPMLHDVVRARPSQVNGSEVASRIRVATVSTSPRSADALEQDEKLVSSLPAHGVLEAHAPVQALAEHAQQLVADRVAERVVDGLEPVEVEEQHGDVAAARAGPGGGLLEALAQADPVGQTRERVVVRHELDPRLGGLAGGDVVEHPDVVRDPALCVAHRRHAHPRRERLARPAPEGDLAFPAAAGEECLSHRVDDRVAVPVRSDHRRPRLGAEDLLGRQPRDLDERGVHPHDPLRLVDDHDGGRAAEEDLVGEPQLPGPLVDASVQVGARALRLLERALERHLAEPVDVAKLEEPAVRSLARQVERERQDRGTQHREGEVHELRGGREGPDGGAPGADCQDEGIRAPTAWTA